MEKLAQSLGIESLSRSQVSEMSKGLNDQVEFFRNRSLETSRYPVLWVDALYEKVRMDGRVVSAAILVVCGVDEAGKREVLAVERCLKSPAKVIHSYSRVCKTVA
jgi:transposase-like protein